LDFLEEFMNYYNYKVMLRPEPEGGFTVIVPSLPGCMTYGATLSEAKEMAKEAIELYLESLISHDDISWDVNLAGKST
jgi:antitoxin HicB